jgi:hypothetical protein
LEDDYIKIKDEYGLTDLTSLSSLNQLVTCLWLNMCVIIIAVKDVIKIAAGDTRLNDRVLESDHFDVDEVVGLLLLSWTTA